MAEQTQHTQQKADKKSGTRIPIISNALSVIFKTMSVTIFAGFVSVLFELALYFIVEHPVDSSYERYVSTSNFVTGSWFDGAKYSDSLEVSIDRIVDIQSAAVVLTEWAQISVNYIDSIPTYGELHAALMGLISKVASSIPELFSLWLIATFSWIAKILSITALLVPCGLILGAAFIDGSVERKINTFKGKRDSQDKIEWWYLLFKSSSYTVLFIYVAIPNGMQAATIMFPASVISALFLRNVVANYKKYW